MATEQNPSAQAYNTPCLIYGNVASLGEILYCEVLHVCNIAQLRGLPHKTVQRFAAEAVERYHDANCPVGAFFDAKQAFELAQEHKAPVAAQTALETHLLAMEAALKATAV